MIRTTTWSNLQRSAPLSTLVDIDYAKGDLWTVLYPLMTSGDVSYRQASMLNYWNAWCTCRLNEIDATMECIRGHTRLLLHTKNPSPQVCHDFGRSIAHRSLTARDFILYERATYRRTSASPKSSSSSSSSSRPLHRVAFKTFLQTFI